MELYELKNGRRMANALLETPFNSDCLDFKGVDECFPDFIKIGYNDEKLLKDLPFYPVESTAFSIETTGENPEIKFDIFYEEDYLREKDMETLEVVFDQAEKDELQTILLKVVCDLLYGTPMFLKNRLEPSTKDIHEVRQYLGDFGIDTDIPEFDTVGELWLWRSKQYKKRVAI